MRDTASSYKRLDVQAEKYRTTHDKMFVCPFCNSFLTPWSWYGKREKARKDYVFQYTCQCNIRKREGSPSWYEVTIKRWGASDWSFFNGTEWQNPNRVPFFFNPSVR